MWDQPPTFKLYVLLEITIHFQPRKSISKSRHHPFDLPLTLIATN